MRAAPARRTAATAPAGSAAQALAGGDIEPLMPEGCWPTSPALRLAVVGVAGEGLR